MAARHDTIRDHQERLNRAIQFIQQHLDEALRLDQLAAVACFSPFHFHRIFAAGVGEGLREYVKRLRIEQAAHRLLHTKISVTEIALAAGYQTPSAFNRAFQQRFRTSPTAYRRRGIAMISRERKKRVPNTIQEKDMLKPEIRTRPESKAVYVRRIGKYQQSAKEAWEAVCRFAFPRHLVGKGTEFIGISHDDPSITAEDKLRYDACVTVQTDVKPEGEVGVLTIPGGKYAVFMHCGSYDGLKDVYGEIYGGWLPASGVKLRDVSCFEVYLDDPDRVPASKLRTEICIPIE